MSLAEYCNKAKEYLKIGLADTDDPLGGAMKSVIVGKRSPDEIESWKKGELLTEPYKSNSLFRLRKSIKYLYGSFITRAADGAP